MLDLIDLSIKQSEEKNEVINLLKNLREECAQIYEFSVEEDGLIKQLCEMLSDVQAFFKIGVELPKTLFPFSEEIEHATLSLSCDIVLVKNNVIESQHLSKYESPIVVDILKEAVPKITDYAKKHRETLGERIGLLEKLTRELKKLHDMKKIQEEDVAPDQYLLPEISSEDLENSS